MPTFDTMEAAAVSFGLEPVQERVLKIPLKEDSFWLKGVSWAITFKHGRARMQLWVGQVPAWAALVLTGLIFSPLMPRATIHPLNGEAKVLLLFLLFAFAPWVFVFLVAWRVRWKLLRRAQVLEN